MNLQEAQTCLITLCRSLRKSIQGNRFLQVMNCIIICWSRYIYSLFFNLIEFDLKRKDAVSTNERLQQEAQAVLDVIENPDVAQALRQDKNQNLQYLKDNYNVRPCSSHL